MKPFLKMIIVMVFMFLHSSSLDSSTKSTSLKSDFKQVKHLYIKKITMCTVGHNAPSASIETNRMFK